MFSLEFSFTAPLNVGGFALSTVHFLFRYALSSLVEVRPYWVLP